MVFAFCGVVLLIWFVWALSMQSPKNLSNLVLSIGKIKPSEQDAVHQELSQLSGVAEVVVMSDEGVAYLKVDKRNIDEADIAQAQANILKSV